MCGQAVAGADSKRPSLPHHQSNVFTKGREKHGTVVVRPKHVCQVLHSQMFVADPKIIPMNIYIYNIYIPMPDAWCDRLGTFGSA